ncbi:hypothetical protein CBD41_05170 [bacterium TMED181]|nr:hypothetical protein [Planctomycetota bacterium]OUW44745.1 MAG: hypothetical protein CBD41_05170 [bacterium TMED181]
MSYLQRFRDMEAQGVDILALLAGDQTLDDSRLEILSRLLGPLEQDYHADLLELLTHERHDPERARDLWRGIVQHKKEMERALGRTVGVRVAAADYLIHDRQVLEAPRLISREPLTEMLKQVTLDPLTQLPNRRQLDEILRRELKRARRYGGKFTVLMIDLDLFKSINDGHGHIAGDMVLQEVSQRLAAAIRETDTLGRWGGDEWLMVLPETAPEDALILTRRLRKDVREKAVILGDGTAIHTSLSIGLSGYPGQGRTIQDLVSEASEALRSAKGAGRDAEGYLPVKDTPDPSQSGSVTD